jgi:AcrR family transcriptional regulator
MRPNQQRPRASTADDAVDRNVAAHAAGGGRSPAVTATRMRILAAALELFAERGFASTTTVEIARRAKVAEKTVFAHFSSKAQLFDETLSPSTIDQIIPEVLTPFEDALHENSEHLGDLLRALFANRMQIIRRHPSKFKLIIQELLLRPERARDLLSKREDGITPLLQSAFKALRTRGELRDVPLPFVFRVYAYTLLGYAVERLLFSPSDEANYAADIDRLVVGLAPRSVAPHAKRRAARQKRAR